MSFARLIINPAAGAGKTAHKWPHIVSFLKEQGLDFSHVLTEAPHHATELASEAVNEGCELIVSVGGDGTLHEIVNGIVTTNSSKNIKLGIVSTGTGSDYARTFNKSTDYMEACKLLLHPAYMLVDLGLVECTSNGEPVHRYFLNFAGLGFDVDIVLATTIKYKKLGRMSSYLMGLLSTFIVYKNKTMKLVMDGTIEDRKICTILMGIGKYGGGGMLTTPLAEIDDGLFDVLMVGDLSKPDLLWSLPRIYKGTHLTHPKVILKKLKEIEVHPQEQMFVQADGEIVGEAPAHFKMIPSALNIIV
jgi:diacylglycerol kinase (ATP)